MKINYKRICALCATSAATLLSAQKKPFDHTVYDSWESVTQLDYLLHGNIRGASVGRDKYFDILRATNMLIKLRRSYHITANYCKNKSYKKIQNSKIGFAVLN